MGLASRFSLALSTSLLVHALLALVVALLPDVEQEAVPARQAVAIELVEVPASAWGALALAQEARSTAPSVAPTQAVREPARPKRTAAAARSAQASVSQVGEPSGGVSPGAAPESSSSQGAPTAVAPESSPGNAPPTATAPVLPGGVDGPRPQASLFPVIPGVGGGRGVNTDPTASRGHLIVNDGLGPDPAAVAEVNAEQAGRKVQGWTASTLGALRVEHGVVNPYYRELGAAIQGKVAKAPRFTEENPFAPKAVKGLPKEVKDLLSAWGTANESYARTGNPYAAGAVPEGGTLLRAESPGERVARELPGTAAAEVMARARAASTLRDFASGKMGQGLLALVELRQASDGSLAGAVLVRSSGNGVFDRHVMQKTPEAFATLRAPPDAGPGMGPELRTLWAFEGRITFLRKLAPGESAGLKTIGAMTLLSMLTAGFVPGATGYFDETTGETYLVDFSNPQYTCTARLLEVH